MGGVSFVCRVPFHSPFFFPSWVHAPHTNNFSVFSFCSHHTDRRDLLAPHRAPPFTTFSPHGDSRFCLHFYLYYTRSPPFRHSSSGPGSPNYMLLQHILRVAHTDKRPTLDVRVNAPPSFHISSAVSTVHTKSLYIILSGSTLSHIYPRSGSVPVRFKCCPPSLDGLTL
jgi:hypothetical protein